MTFDPDIWWTPGITLAAAKISHDVYDLLLRARHVQ